MTERWTWKRTSDGYRVQDSKGVQVCVVAEERVARMIAAAPALAAFAAGARRILRDNRTDINFLLKQMPPLPINDEDHPRATKSTRRIQ